MHTIVVLKEVFVDYLQRKVRTSRGEALKVRTFLRGGGHPPSGADIDLLCCSWGVSYTPLLLLRAPLLPWSI